MAVVVFGNEFRGQNAHFIVVKQGLLRQLKKICQLAKNGDQALFKALLLGGAGGLILDVEGSAGGGNLCGGSFQGRRWRENVTNLENRIVGGRRA